MKKVILLLFLGCNVLVFAQSKNTNRKVEALLRQMTLEEKIGQLNQYTGDNAATGISPLIPTNKPKSNKD